MNTYQAIVTSIGEPQTTACLNSLKKQAGKSRFTTIDLIKDVSPSYIAHNKAIDLMTADWVLKADADMIFFKSLLKAVETITKKAGDDTFSASFLLYDSFIMTNIKGVKIYRTSVIKNYRFENKLGLDKEIRRLAKQDSYKEITSNTVVGTHFKNPSPFQVYRRFFMRGIKERANHKSNNYKIIKENLLSLFTKTKNRLYLIGIDAYETGLQTDYNGDYSKDFAIEQWIRSRYYADYNNFR